ncbi:MAG TPA: type II and III secretion system protein [Firmicutes bacterium]|nr:type II and III secretion system protein [Bacillota bacterium]
MNTYLTLGVERVTSRDEIRLYYEVVAQDLAQSVTSPLPEVLTRLANGRVIVENNAAFVIGGLTKSVQQENSGAIPPYALQNTQDTELLILILPHILGTPRLEQDPLEDYYTKFIQRKGSGPGQREPAAKGECFAAGTCHPLLPGTYHLFGQPGR